MKLTVITPVGPGHEQIVERCIQSVKDAKYSNPYWTTIVHRVIEDHTGRWGRSKARNIGMDTDADWFFFLDADDIMSPDALYGNDPNASATFGTIKLKGMHTLKDVHPCTWKDIAVHGAGGTLSMGFYCKAKVARELKFNEDMNAGEDFDFYVRLPDFVKIGRPLVTIGRDIPSATGPRGYRTLDWTAVCNDVIRKAYEREPEKFAVSRDALLAKAGRPRSKPGTVPEAV